MSQFKSKSNSDTIFQSLFSNSSKAQPKEKEKGKEKKEANPQTCISFSPLSSDECYSDCLEIMDQLLSYWSPLKKHHMSIVSVFHDFDRFENQMCSLGLLSSGLKKFTNLFTWFKKQFSQASGIPLSMVNGLLQMYVVDVEKTQSFLQPLCLENESTFQKKYGDQVLSYFVYTMTRPLDSLKKDFDVSKAFKKNKELSQLHQFQICRANLFGLFSLFQMVCPNNPLFSEKGLDMDRLQTLMEERGQLFTFLSLTEESSLKEVFASLEQKSPFSSVLIQTIQQEKKR